MNTPRLFRNTSPARLFLAAIFAALLLPTTAPAAFHFWQIREIYTNFDGSVQFIELFTTSASQQFTNAQTITVSNGSTTHTFTFPSDTAVPTNNHALLIATPNITLFGGPTPDFILSPNFLFTTNSISIEFNGTTQGTVNFSGLPTSNNLSMMFPGNTTQVGHPQNFAGTIGTIIPEPMTWSMLGLGGLGLAFALRRRAK